MESPEPIRISWDEHDSRGQMALMMRVVEAMRRDPGGRCFVPSPPRVGKSRLRELFRELYEEDTAS